MSNSRRLETCKQELDWGQKQSLPMAVGSNEVEQRMNTIIAEAGVTLDTGLLCENIVVLSFKIANNLTEAFI